MARVPPATPPIAFARVTPGIYRSGFPSNHNLPFLQRLGLRTMIKLEDVEYTGECLKWIKEMGITVTECAVAANQEPFVTADPDEICKALRVLMDVEKHPVLIHSLVGQARVGVVIGCLRRLQRWSLVAIFDEYRRFAGSQASLLDLQTIELFDLSLVHIGGLLGAATRTPKSPAMPPSSSSKASMSPRAQHPGTASGGSSTEQLPRLPPPMTADPRTSAAAAATPPVSSALGAPPGHASATRSSTDTSSSRIGDRERNHA